MLQGEPIVGILHSADPSAGVPVVIYNQGSRTARTLAVDEYIEVHSIEAVSTPGGDLLVYFGTSGTPATGSTILEGTVAANGGIVKSSLMRTGLIGENVYCKAPAGVTDVIFNGSIRKSGNIKPRQSYQSSLVPGA